MKRLALALGLSALLIFGLAGPAGAAGAYIGTGLGYSFPNYGGDIGEMDAQGAFSWEYLHVGYDFTDNLGVNLLWGNAAATGEVDLGPTFGSEEIDVNTSYIDLNFRYTFKGSVSPYLEAGVGSYSTLADGDGATINLDPVVGYRLGLGAIIPISQFYIAPEFSYHWASFDEYEVEIDNGPSLDLDGAGAGDFGLFALKVGYRFGK